MRWAWPAVTDRSRWWPPQFRMTFRLCASRRGRAHFALDVGVDRQDVPGPIEAFTSGVERRIDMADVNGRLYLNNVSLGIYGDAVRRPGYRDAKVRTLLETAEAVLGPSGQVPPLRLVDDAGREHRSGRRRARVQQPLRAGSPGGPRHPPRAGHRSARDCRARCTWRRPVPPGTGLDRAGPGGQCAQTRSAGIDGEAMELSPPLRFAIRPATLRVRISARHPGISPSARFPRPRA